MNFTYCTLFDKNYLPQALSLIESLKNNISFFSIYCFCMDEESLHQINKIKSQKIIPISYKQLENHYSDLKIIKTNRSIAEYYFTCTSAICSYLFDHFGEIELLTYLDADLYFFSPPDSIYEELENASVGIIEHKFSFFGLKYEKYGKYNVGWVSFRNDPTGRRCLEDWKRDCFEWCYDRLENNKFADQKYLDFWQEKYSRIKVIENIGANLAPWNVGRYHLTIVVDSNTVFVDNQKLIFYHFASFKKVASNRYVTHVSQYFVPLKGVLRNNIYMKYLASIIKYNITLGIETNAKNRVGYTNSGLKKHIRNYSRKLRQFIFLDSIILP